MSDPADGRDEPSGIASTGPAGPAIADGPPGLSPQNTVEVAALLRHLHRTRGFSLALVVVNHPTTRDEVLTHLVRATVGLEVRLRRGAGGPVSQVEASLGSGSPTAVFLVGLELLVEDGPSAALDNLNLNRDFLARRLACPLVILGPAWLAGSLARGATDLWSVRSNVFELVGDAKAGRATIEDAAHALTWEAAPAERQAKALLLEDLAQEAIDSGEHNEPYLAALARARGDAARMLSRYEEAEGRFGEALAVYRQIGDRLGEAGALLSWSRLRRMQGAGAEAVADLDEAARIYDAIGLSRWADIASGEARELESRLVEGQVAP